MATEKRVSHRGLWWVGLLAAICALTSIGCDRDRSRDEARAEPPSAELKPAPALANPAQNAQGDESTAQPSKPADGPEEAKGNTPDVDEPAAERDEDEGDEHRSAKRRAPSSRRRASSSPGPDAPAAQPTASGLKVKRIQFAEDVKSREPVSPEETFAASQTEKLYAFIELSNEPKKKAKIVVRFIPPMGSSTKVTLDVGDKARWRTWALRRGVKAIGTWTVVVLDESNTELGRRSFEVTE